MKRSATAISEHLSKRRPTENHFGNWTELPKVKMAPFNVVNVNKNMQNV